MSGSMYAIGIDIGGTNIKAGIVRHDRRSVVTGMAPLPRDWRDAIDSIDGLLRDLTSRAHIPAKSIRRVGCGVPGILDRDREVLLTSPNLPAWRRIPLRRRLAQRIGLPVVLENDANLAAYGEYWAGASGRYRNVVTVTIGTGIGGGIILDGRLREGTSGCAGEIGHMIVRQGGRRCGCGRHGCVEQYASAGAIVRAYRRLCSSPSTVTARDVFALAREGSAEARKAIRECMRFLASALAGLISVIEPEIIVLSGGVSQAGALLRNIVRREVDLLTAAHLRKACRIECGSLGNWAGVIGAAGWALHHSACALKCR